ncbi:MAG: PilZ domain-containing protein [Desulfovibrio sp.]|nr:MAG: PilZ domain-containing protein [Desulfovibrio sp.]
MADERPLATAPTNIRAMYRRMASAESLPVFYDATPLMSEHAMPSLEASGLSEGLAAFLTELNTKLDSILSLLTTDQLTDDFPLTAQVMEISGQGALFVSPEKISPGDSLEMVFVLSRMPLRLAGGVVQVTDVDTFDGSPRYRGRFTNIRQRDQEALVQFVFHEQRQQIRSAKWD